MRNSWFPMIGLLVVGVAIYVVVIQDPTVERGGPQITSGLFRITDTWLPTPKAEHEITVSMQENQDILAMDRTRDRREALEIVPWDQVGIIVDDLESLSSTLAHALGEHLTGYLHDHGDADLSPVPAESRAYMLFSLPREGKAVPAGLRRLIRIRTLKHNIPHRTDDPYKGQVQVTMHDSLRPFLRDWSGLLPSGGIREGSWTVDVSFKVAQEIAWHEWYILLGRRLAGEVLKSLFVYDGQMELAYDEQKGRAERIIERQTLGLSMDTYPQFRSLGWVQALPPKPEAGVERWLGAFQTPLARGWNGILLGHQARKRGKTEGVIDILSERLEKNESLWSVPMELKGGMAWDGQVGGRYDRLELWTRPWGHELGIVQQLPNADKAFLVWCDAATDGDARSRRQLRRHVNCRAIMPQHRQKGRAVLRQNPDLAELAVLGLTEDAKPAEKQALALVRYLRGISDEVPTEVDTVTAIGPEPVQWDGRPFGFRCAGHFGMLTQDVHGVMQLRMRAANGQESTTRFTGTDLHSGVGVSAHLIVKPTEGGGGTLQYDPP